MCATTSRSSPRAAVLLTDAGIVTTRDTGPVGEGVADVPEHLRLFVDQADRVLGELHELEEAGEMNAQACDAFRKLLVEACVRVLCHPIVANNLYLRRFARGVTFAQARH